ncbi:MAG TPA: hypothetical protein VE198_00590 [Actinoallomurus sp.]|jgi:threonine dehydrogenase-like Zn-dependent dehydrogenase|nr:hypothetical protein [Actinoallomurus sp.]
MRALVYHGPGEKAWEEVPKPQIIDDTDAVVRVRFVTHHFPLEDFIRAYEVFADAGETGALKVVLTR